MSTQEENSPLVEESRPYRHHVNTKLVLWVLSLSIYCPKPPYQLSLYNNIWTGAFYENASQPIHELLIVYGHIAASEDFRLSPVNYLYNFSFISNPFYSIEQILPL